MRVNNRYLLFIYRPSTWSHFRRSLAIPHPRSLCVCYWCQYLCHCRVHPVLEVPGRALQLHPSLPAMMGVKPKYFITQFFLWLIQDISYEYVRVKHHWWKWTAALAHFLPLCKVIRSVRTVIMFCCLYLVRLYCSTYQVCKDTISAPNAADPLATDVVAYGGNKG